MQRDVKLWHILSFLSFYSKVSDIESRIAALNAAGMSSDKKRKVTPFISLSFISKTVMTENICLYKTLLCLCEIKQVDTGVILRANVFSVIMWHDGL